MANEEQLALLKRSFEGWHNWRKETSFQVPIDLSEADLSGEYLVDVELNKADLHGANLQGADLDQAILRTANLHAANLRDTILRGADLIQADLSDADLSGANIQGAHLSGANLRGANLKGADLYEADLRGANLSSAILTEAMLYNANLSETQLKGANLTEAQIRSASLFRADLSGAVLRGAILSETDLREANLSETDLHEADISNSSLVGANINNAKISKSKVYGVSVWDLEGEFKEQEDLIITPEYEAAITVDNIKVAQFVYLLLNNKELRDVINTLTSKTVLILGRFAITERKEILDALRTRLREYDLLPIVFDFDRPIDKDFTETIKTLAGISYFVIADITNPKSSPLELQATVPDYQIPFVPIIQEGESPFAMMVDLQKKYNWVLPTRSYDSIETLLAALKPGIIDPAVEMKNKLRLVKAQEQVTESLKDYLGKTL